MRATAPNILKLIDYVDAAVKQSSPRIDRYVAHLRSAFRGEIKNFDEWQAAAQDLPHEYQKLVAGVRAEAHQLCDNQELAKFFSRYDEARRLRPPGVLLQAAGSLVWASDVTTAAATAVWSRLPSLW